MDRHARRVTALLGCAALVALGACGWDPARPFDRESPPVKEALVALDAGDATAAAKTLGEYLSTGQCADGNIGTPETLKKKPNGAYDLGLALFQIGESYGRRFGEEENEPPAGSPGAAQSDDEKQRRAAQIDCALRVVRAVALDPTQPVELRARARYLEGNLLFLGARYEDAVTAYDESLRLSPGMVDAGDPVGRDAAWNRAIALRRIDDKKDAGQDAAQDSGGDGGGDGGGDSGKSDGGSDAGGDGGGRGDGGDKPDAGSDASSGNDAGHDASQPPPPQSDEDAGPPPPSKADQDERMLDQLENAPTVQQEDAKKAAQRRRVRGSLDK